VKPVNLLPAAERPRATVAAPANASTLVMATLALLLVAVAAFVFTKNQVTDRKADIAKAQQEQTAAEQRSNGLKSFGDFSQIKQTRVQSVTQLATQRFDWERFMRELALVLPDKVWLTGVTSGADAAGASGSTSTSTSAGSSSPSAASSSSTTSSAGGAATGSTSAGPSAQLAGCASTQKAVAELIVRLRSLHGAQDVTLQDSTKTEDLGGSADAAGAGAGAGSGQGCGKNYVFQATVSFAAPTAAPTAGKSGSKPARVPARLGGGA
jgi:Tfp pilus assembly protein PilN